MASQHLSEFEKGSVVAYNDCRLSLDNIAKEMNCYQSSIDVFLKIYKKIGNYWKEGCGRKRKSKMHLKIWKLLGQQNTSTLQLQLKVEIKKNFISAGCYFFCPMLYTKEVFLPEWFPLQEIDTMTLILGLLSQVGL